MRKRLIFSIFGVMALAVAFVPRWTVEAAKSVPGIAAKQSFLGQTTALSGVVLFTPSADNDYRVSFYISGSATCATDSDRFRPRVTVAWMGDSKAESLTTQLDIGNHCSWDAGSVVIHAVSGNPIAASTSLDNNLAGNMYFTVEEL